MNFSRLFWYSGESVKSEFLTQIHFYGMVPYLNINFEEPFFIGRDFPKKILLYKLNKIFASKNNQRNAAFC